MQAESFTIDVPANDSDVDGDALKIVAMSAPAHGTVDVVNDEIVYTSTGTFNGVDTFTYTVDDGHGGQDTATVSVTRSPNLQYLPSVEGD